MEESPVRLCVAQLHDPAVTLDTQSRRYRIGQTSFSCVRILGVCTHCSGSEIFVDDGTGLIKAKVSPSVLEFAKQDLQPGELVDCVGKIEEPWPPSDATSSRRLLHATHVRVVKDRNTESLRMLQVLHLYKNYCAAPTAVVSFELLPFPALANTTPTRTPIARELSASAINQDVQRQIAPMVEKPQHQRNDNTTGQAGVPPAEYQLVIPAEDEPLIVQGRKTLEIRLNTPPYSIIRANDKIIINGKTSTTVVAVRKYARLESVLTAENVDALLPQRNCTVSASAAVLRHYRQFFSPDEEEQSGVVVFQLAVPYTVKSPAEWSQLVLRQLGTKQGGCSVADLQFAFPSLPVAQIDEILVNLQYDGMVFHANDRYQSI